MPRPPAISPTPSRPALGTTGVVPLVMPPPWKAPTSGGDSNRRHLSIKPVRRQLVPLANTHCASHPPRSTTAPATTASAISVHRVRVGEVHRAACSLATFIAFPTPPAAAARAAAAAATPMLSARPLRTRGSVVARDQPPRCCWRHLVRSSSVHRGRVQINAADSTGITADESTVRPIPTISPRAHRQERLRRVLPPRAVEGRPRPARLARAESVQIVPRVHVLQRARTTVTSVAAAASVAGEEIGRVSAAELVKLTAILAPARRPVTINTRVNPHSHGSRAEVGTRGEAEIVLASAVGHVGVVPPISSSGKLREVCGGRGVHSVAVEFSHTADGVLERGRFAGHHVVGRDEPP